MIRSLSTWLLAGALCASLSWNLFPARPAGDAAPGETACAETACGPCPPEALDLGAEQRAELTLLCGRSCGESARLEREADRLHALLLEDLARPEVDRAALAERVRAVSDLRRRALEACVDGILEVRRILTAEQLGRLLQGCAASGAGCR